MSTFVFDPLYIKSIEKAIGRKLDEFEKEAVQYGEPIYLQKIDGSWSQFNVPYYKFPLDIESINGGEFSFFDFSFNTGTIRKNGDSND